MHVVLVAICYPPEVRSISIMLRELAEELVARGHRVTVLAPWPRYHLSADARARHFEPVMEENGVRVIRIRTLPAHGIAYVLRGIAHLDLPRRYLRAYREHVRERVDAVISYISPLPLALVGQAIAREHGRHHLLNVQDIFPQNAIDLGIMRNRALIAYFERMERQVYAAADAIATHTPGGREFLIARKGVSPEKVAVIPNWIDAEAWDRAQPTGAFRARYGLAGEFVILFAGILGPAQDIPFTLEVAARIRDIPDITFLLIGDGTERARAVAWAEARGLSNVHFAPFVDPVQYPSLVKEMDVGLLTLGMGNRTATMPGKLWGYMAAGIPVLAFLNRECDAHRIIREARCGYSALSEDPDRAAALVRKLYAERAQLPTLGHAGRTYAAVHYGKQSCIDQLERLLIREPAARVRATV